MENRTKQLKENFEKLEDVSEIFKNLHPTIIWFCEKGLKYSTSFAGFDEKVAWLNGAWYVFQELNKVKEKTKKVRNSSKEAKESLQGFECTREAMFRSYKG